MVAVSRLHLCVWNIENPPLFVLGAEGSFLGSMGPVQSLSPLILQQGVDPPRPYSLLLQVLLMPKSCLGYSHLGRRCPAHRVTLRLGPTVSVQ